MKLKGLGFFDISKNNSPEINPVFFGWLSQNYNGLSPAIAGKIHQAALKKLRQQAKKDKERQKLQNTKNIQFYVMIFLGIGVCITFVFVGMVARIAKHQIAGQTKGKKHI